MPKRKLSRRLSDNDTQGLHEDNQLRDYSVGASLNLSISGHNAEALNLKTVRKTPSPKTQTTDPPPNEAITETPRVNHDHLLDLDYEVKRLCTPVSEYRTPLKGMLPDNITPIYDMKDSAIRIQDLSVDYNCEMPEEMDIVHNKENQEVMEINSSTEISFFTAQFYNGKTASTPIEKNKVKSVSVSKRRIYNSLPLTDSFTATETCAKILRYSSKLPGKMIDMCTCLGFAIIKVIMSLYKFYMQKHLLEGNPKNGSDDYLTQISALTASMENLHEEIKLLRQQLHEHQNTTSLLHSESELLRQQLHEHQNTTSLLHSELELIRQQLHEHQNPTSLLHSESELIRQQPHDDIKQELQEIKEQLVSQPSVSMQCGALPPQPPLPPLASLSPPPPLPPLASLPNISLTNQKVPKTQQKKKNENSMLIISLEDIRNVKLRKISERPSALPRNTEPSVSSTFNVKLKPISRPQTPSSIASPSDDFSKQSRERENS